jgi:hypothetical protein
MHGAPIESALSHFVAAICNKIFYAIRNGKAQGTSRWQVQKRDK